MTANGEAFNPRGLSAAHKHSPLPTNVEVTNLENGRSIIVRVNDRGPFPSVNNPHFSIDAIGREGETPDVVTDHEVQGPMVHH